MEDLRQSQWDGILADAEEDAYNTRYKCSEPTTSNAMAIDTLPSPPSSSVSVSPAESVSCESLETPASFTDESDASESISAAGAPSTRNPMLHGLHVLNTEAAALSYLAQVYATDEAAQDGFEKSVQAIATGHTRGGKVVVIGVGKSGHIGKKLSHTLQSLGIPALFLHPTEALHGDMGVIGANDTLLFITYSGRTPELLTLVSYLDTALPTILLTSHTRSETCLFLEEQHRPDAILLPAPVKKEHTEVTAFGVAAPMTSTTVALAVGDALAMAAAREIHGQDEVKSVFAKNHPGGAIGMLARR